MQAYFDPENQAFLRYLDFPGKDPAVVFLAGLGLAATAAYPRVAIEPGLSGRHSILVDVFGCGYSDRPDHFAYSIEAHASTLSGLLDHIGSRQYVLVGHSMGGAIAIELAAKRPDLVTQLILAEANLFPGGGLFSTSIANQTEFDFVKSGYEELIAHRREAAMGGNPIFAVPLGMWQMASPLAMHRTAVSAVRGTQPVMWDNLISLPIPRTFIFGSRSLEEYEEDRELYGRLEDHDIQVAVVPDAGHGMLAENPAGFAKVVVEALAKNGL